LESATFSNPISDDEISAAVEQEIVKQSETQSTDTASELKGSFKLTAAEIMATARGALARNPETTAAADLTEFEFACLEAIVQVTGRPAMRYLNGQVEMPPELGENSLWRVLVATARQKIDAASASVGRVEANDSRLGGALLGTAWRVGANLAVTNRHVARQLVKNRTKPTSDWQLDDTKNVLINFGVSTGGNSARKCKVSAIGYCAPEKEVDFAVLKLDANPADCPPPLPVDLSPEVLGTESSDGPTKRFNGEQVYVVGHPYDPRGSSAIAKVFGNADGSKRWSPGYVTSVDEADRVFEHDCSTLGGNSGSCVLRAGSHAVVGLHFGGLTVDLSTGMGRANIAIAFSRLGSHPAADILRTGGL